MGVAEEELRCAEALPADGVHECFWELVASNLRLAAVCVVDAAGGGNTGLPVNEEAGGEAAVGGKALLSMEVG